jgi:hypothetical protein
MGVAPVLIHFVWGIFHYKPSISGIPHLWNLPYGQIKTKVTEEVTQTTAGHLELYEERGGESLLVGSVVSSTLW